MHRCKCHLVSDNKHGLNVTTNGGIGEWRMICLRPTVKGSSSRAENTKTTSTGTKQEINFSWHLSLSNGLLWLNRNLRACSVQLFVLNQITLTWQRLNGRGGIRNFWFKKNSTPSIFFKAVVLLIQTPIWCSYIDNSNFPSRGRQNPTSPQLWSITSNFSNLFTVKQRVCAHSTAGKRPMWLKHFA